VQTLTEIEIYTSKEKQFKSFKKHTCKGSKKAGFFTSSQEVRKIKKGIQKKLIQEEFFI
jgi:hypothetical protein